MSDERRRGARGDGAPQRRWREERSVQEDARILLPGIQAISALLQHAPERIIELKYQGKLQGARAELIARAEALGVSCRQVRQRELENDLPEVKNQGLLAVAESAPATAWEELLVSRPQRIVALDQVTDPRNLGAILRSAEALGVGGALLTSNRCARRGPVVARSSAGASELIPVSTVTNLSRALRESKEHGYWIVGADMGGTPAAEVDWDRPTLFVIGAEGRGLRPSTRGCCDLLVSVPLSGVTESLNAAVAASLLFYEAGRRGCAPK